MKLRQTLKLSGGSGLEKQEIRERTQEGLEQSEGLLGEMVSSVSGKHRGSFGTVRIPGRRIGI